VVAGGDRIVYAGRRDTGLLVADATGRTAPRRVEGVPRGGVAEAQWSPDGSLIAFRSGGALYVIRPDGTGSRRIASGYVHGVSWSPESRSLAFVGPASPRSMGDLSVVDRDGSGLHRVGRCSCTLRGPGFWPSVVWSPNGSRLAYVGERGNVVATVRPDGTGATRVATQRGRGLHGGWYPSAPLWRPATRG
jgi:Tol biopolymer transport system component